jgi:CRP-like cAMP-binding protein
VWVYQSRQEKKNELARLRLPAVFAEMAFILREHKRTATATALEHCEVVEISRQEFNDYVDRSPSVISSILKALADRLLTTTMKALRTPDLFMGACEILHLFGKNGKSDLPYDFN